MNYPNPLVEAVTRHWPIQSTFERDFRVQELRDDWIVWRTQDSDKAGGVRLVVPKNGSNAFEIPSAAIADDQHGVSCDYIIHVVDRGQATSEAAGVQEKHTGLRRVEAYRCLKSKPEPLRSYYIIAPLDLIKELAALNVRVQLERPGGRGGYYA
jgi:hypothetical protein